MSKKEKSSENNTDKAEEPSTAFKTVRVFNSVDEMEQDELNWLAGLSPEEHLQHATSLIKRVYAEELEKHPEIGTHVYFDLPL